jgi:GT2 family glycosyltransferase
LGEFGFSIQANTRESDGNDANRLPVTESGGRRRSAAVSPDPLRVAVGIPTTGRPDILAGVLASLRIQTRPADRIIVCHAASADVADPRSVPGVEFISTAAGLPRQRNRIIEMAGDCDALLFLDDDFILGPRYIEATLAALQSDPAIVVTTGALIADGAKGPGLSARAATDLIAGDHYQGPWPGLSPAWNGYGCNMAIRLAAVRGGGLRFDERLPLYGWYEDVDFTRRLGRLGRMVRVAAARGVHLGVKTGRTSGLRLGYSQIANPLYLLGKGSVPWYFAMQSAGRHCVKNLLWSLWPEPYTDRRGRLIGNTLALRDLLLGRIKPERILELGKADR